MKPDPNYPRWMYHASRDPVIIHSEAEEAALGREWSRLPVSALPEKEKPLWLPEAEEGVSPPAPAETEPAPPPARPRQGRPAAPKPPPHKTTAHKRG